jgi:glycosyltransferase involved in cell wall biosynthesis
MHYCFLLTFGLKSAASLRMQQIGAALIEQGVRVSYILTDDDGDASRLPPAAHIERIPRAAPIKSVLARRKALRRLGPDFVEVLNPHPQTLLPLAGMRHTRVIGLWDEPPIVHNLGPAGRLAARAWNRWLLKRSWLKVVASTHLQELFRARFGVATTYLPHVTYMPAFPDGPSPFTDPTVVYVGTLYPSWDHDLIFAAARELARRGRSPAFCIIGSGPDLQRWTDYVREYGLDRVRLAGFLSEEEMWRNIRHAHALLFPMRETLLNRSRCSSKLLAYAQARRPVIANRVGEAPQILGELPIWVDPTPEAFADAIDRVASSPRPPDVDYDLHRLSPAVRAAELLEAIHQRELAGT